MKALLLLIAVLALTSVPLQRGHAQGSVDWDVLWYLPHQQTTNGPYGWMAGHNQYSGLAYDVFRDALYVVNPAICTVGGTSLASCPKIWIIDPQNGQMKTSIGRALNGQGGQIPVPTDTIHGIAPGWPDYSYGSSSLGAYPIYKIDVDNEGRIYVCNLASPIWGVCRPPQGPCDSVLLKNGPLRVFRWDTPASSPQRVYATLDSTYSATGSFYSSEMTRQRFGDAFLVVGKRHTIPGTPPIVVDSILIIIAGGEEINVLVPDIRPNRPGNGLGGQLEFRLGTRYVTPASNTGVQGIAVEGRYPSDDIWIGNDSGIVKVIPQIPPTGPLPRTIVLPQLHTLSNDTISGTGLSGPLAFISIPPSKLLACADGLLNPSSGGTRARVMDVTIRGQEHRAPGLGNTPLLSNKNYYPSSGDIDYKLEFDPASGKYRIILFVLMPNNGIAAFRSKILVNPIELLAFTGEARPHDVQLHWITASETRNLGFEIERSFHGGKDWKRIGFVQGSGNSTTQRKYEYLDPLTDGHKASGIVHYRLKQIDSDGLFEFSPAVEVFLPRDADILTFHPPQRNLESGATSVSYTLNKPTHVTLTLHSLLGEKLAVLVDNDQLSGKYEYTLDGELPSGVYLCSAVTSEGIRTTKVVITR